MILQINTEYAWVEFKPAKDNMPDSVLIYGGLSLGQFHSDVMLSSGREKARNIKHTSTAVVRLVSLDRKLCNFWLL